MEYTAIGRDRIRFPLTGGSCRLGVIATPIVDG